MEPEAVEAVIRALRPGPYGWQCELPAPIRFFRQPVELRLDTRSVPADEPPPAPDPAEVGLARLILGGLPGVLAECERQYREYNADFPELLGKVHEPHVWVCREWLGDEPPGEWAFVVGISDAPDWGIHTEFRGLEFQRIWSGD